MRLTWLADVLRAEGLRVIEVDGWEDRGPATFNPVGVTWHATAGSKSGTAQGEVHTILTGSETAPAPIAQLMLFRDGTFYVCASGRCNHNKIGWDGPNEGLGNSDLVGLEMANNNKGEPWPEVQLDAARRGTAAIMRRLGADPMRRLAAHYEHQPYATRPAGEGSTKSDPYGVDMTLERPRVAALMTKDDDVNLTDTIKLNTTGTVKYSSPTTTVEGVLRSTNYYVLQSRQMLLAELRKAELRDAAVLKAVGGVDDEGILARVAELAAKLAKLPDEVADAIVDADRPVSETADALRAVLGDRAAEVGRLLANLGPAE